MSNELNYTITHEPSKKKKTHVSHVIRIKPGKMVKIVFKPSKTKSENLIRRDKVAKVNPPRSIYNSKKKKKKKISSLKNQRTGGIADAGVFLITALIALVVLQEFEAHSVTTALQFFDGLHQHADRVTPADSVVVLS
uniref:Uncharacterized protein n=1 Tax=Anopheles atroparvus TaxID=41427 RepID=A0AAG5D930_ANOAO